MWIKLLLHRPVSVLPHKIQFTVLRVLGSQLSYETSADPSGFASLEKSLQVLSVKSFVGINDSSSLPCVCCRVKKKKSKALNPHLNLINQFLYLQLVYKKSFMMQNNLSWCTCKKGQQRSIFIVVEEWAALLCNNPIVKLARGILEIVSFPPPRRMPSPVRPVPSHTKELNSIWNGTKEDSSAGKDVLSKYDAGLLLSAPVILFSTDLSLLAEKTSHYSTLCPFGGKGEKRWALRHKDKTLTLKRDFARTPYRITVLRAFPGCPEMDTKDPTWMWEHLPGKKE